MNFCQILYSVFPVYILFQLSGSNAKNIEWGNEPVVNSKENSRYVVTTDHEACKCVQFYDCPSSLYGSSDLNSCPDFRVCCKVSPTETTGTTVNLPEVTTIKPKCSCVHKSECSPTPRTPRTTWETEHESSYCVKKDYTVCCDRIVKDEIQCGERRSKANDYSVSRNPSTMHTDFGEFPFMASVWDSNGKFVCGASLLSDRMLLTVALHVDGKDERTLQVRVGDYDISSSGQTDEEIAPYQIRSISRVIIHQNYTKRGNLPLNNVAIIITEESFQLESHISPVCSTLQNLCSPDMYNANECLALGWGEISRAPRILEKVDLKLVAPDECQKELRTTGAGPSFNLSFTSLCAVGDTDTCKGDGGGPLVCSLRSDPRRYVQVGITSWGIGCGGRVPAVYESVKAHEQWISSTYDSYVAHPPSPSGTDAPLAS